MFKMMNASSDEDNASEMMAWIKKVHLAILKTCGLICFDHDNRFTIIIRVFLILSWSSVGCASVLITLPSDQFRFADKIVNLINILCMISGVIKLTVFGRSKTVLENLNDEIFDAKWRVKDGKYIWLVVIYYHVAFGIIFLWGLTPIFLGFDTLPYSYWTPFDSEVLTVQIAKFIFAVTYMLLIVVTNLVGDISYMLTAILISQKTKAIRNYLILPIRDRNDPKIKLTNEINVKIALRNFIEGHSDAFSTVKLVDRYMNIIFLLQLVVTTLMLCFICLSLDQVDGFFEILKIVLAGFTIWFELFLFCLFGQIIHDEFDELHTCMFWSKWYKSSLANQKSFLICQALTCRQVWIKGGSLFTISFKTLLSSVREAMSYYMFLRTIIMKNKSELTE